MGEIQHIDQERIDEVIWRNADIKSARQIAEMTGLRPEEVLRRKKELVDEIDDLEIKAIRARLLIDLQKIAREAQEDYNSSPWETKSGLLNNAISAMKLVFAEMNRLEKADTDKVVALNNLRKREIVSLYISVVNRGVKEISEKYGVPEDEMFEVFNQLMREESTRLDV